MDEIAPIGHGTTPLELTQVKHENEPTDKLRIVFLYLLRLLYVQALQGFNVVVTQQDASRLFQSVCIFNSADEDLRSAVSTLIVHFSRNTSWWPDFFWNGIETLCKSPSFAADMAYLAAAAEPSSISLADYCNLFIVLMENNIDQAVSVISFMLEKLNLEIANQEGENLEKIGITLFLSICLDSLLSANHWMADMWSFAPCSLASVKSQWLSGGSSKGTDFGVQSGQHGADSSRSGGGPIHRRGAIKKKPLPGKVGSKVFHLWSFVKGIQQPNSSNSDKMDISGDEKSIWPDQLQSEINAPHKQPHNSTQLFARLPLELCQNVTEKLLNQVLTNYRLRKNQTVMFADVHAFKLAAYLVVFSEPELNLASVFAQNDEKLADLLDLIALLKGDAVTNSSCFTATRSAIRAHAAECFLKTMILAEKVARKVQIEEMEKLDSEKIEGPFASLFTREEPRNTTEDLFNRFFALIHATRCQGKSQQIGKGLRCKAAECQPARKLLDHWRQCDDPVDCPYKYCVSLRLLVNHWRTCKRFDTCDICRELAKVPLVFENQIMSSIENLASCKNLEEDENGIVQVPESKLDPANLPSTLTELLSFPDDSVSDDSDGDHTIEADISSLRNPKSFSSPPLPAFALDSRFDFSLFHHGKYLSNCLQSRNYCDLKFLPRIPLQGVKAIEKNSIDDEREKSDSIQTSQLIIKALSYCLKGENAEKSVSHLARYCEIIDDLLPYTRHSKEFEISLAEWFKVIIGATEKLPQLVRHSEMSFEEAVSLNCTFLETCNALMSKSNGGELTTLVTDFFCDYALSGKWLQNVLIIFDNEQTGFLSPSSEYGPNFSQTFVSFLRGVLEISIGKIQDVGSSLAKSLTLISTHFVEIQVLSLVPVDMTTTLLPFLVEICKSFNILNYLDANGLEMWSKLGANLVKAVALNCSMLPRVEASFKNRISGFSGGTTSSQPQTGIRGRGRGRAIYEGSRQNYRQGANDVVVMRMPPASSDSKCAYPETASAFGSLLSDELSLLEHILNQPKMFSKITSDHQNFTAMMTILFWNGICSRSASLVAANDPSSSICQIDVQNNQQNAIGSQAHKICFNIFQLLVEKFSDSISDLLVDTISKKEVSNETRSVALAIVQSVLDKSPEESKEHRSKIYQILLTCFEQAINNEKQFLTGQLNQSQQKLFEISHLAKVVPGSVNLPLSNLINQNQASGTSTSSSLPSRSNRLLYDLVNSGSAKESGQTYSAFWNPTGEARPVPIPTSQRSNQNKNASICGYTFAPNEDHFSFGIQFHSPVVLAEIVIGCDLSHSRGYLPHACEVEVKSDMQTIGNANASLPLRFAAVSQVVDRAQMPRDCIAVGIDPPQIASSALISVYRPKLSNAVYLNQLSIRGFPLTASGAPQMLVEVDRISNAANAVNSVQTPMFGMSLSSTEVTFLSLLHSISALGRLKLLSNSEETMLGLKRLAVCSAVTMLAPGNVISPTILQNLFEMINVSIST